MRGVRCVDSWHRPPCLDGRCRILVYDATRGVDENAVMTDHEVLTGFAIEDAVTTQRVHLCGQPCGACGAELSR